MGRFKIGIAVALFSALPAMATVTKADIEKYIDSYISHTESCFFDKNIKCMADAMTDDFILIAETTIAEMKVTETLNKEKYLASTMHSWNTYKDYTYKQVNKKIISSTSESPSYSETVIETFTENGIKYEVTSESVIHLEISGGIILANKIEGKSKIKIM